LRRGDRQLLKDIDKGATPEEMVEAGKRAKEAGFEYSLYVLLGIGGENKMGTARKRDRGGVESG